MANIRKRSLPSGLTRWEVAYLDGGGKRRAKLFATKGAAQAWLVEAQHDLKRGLHTASSVSPTIKEAAALWLKRCREKELEASTIRSYEEHIELHLVPLIGSKKLSDLTMPGVSGFADRLREAGRSPEMVRRVVRSLGAIYREARRRGLSATDPTAGLDLNLSSREDPRVVIPSKADLQAVIATAAGRWRPLILTAIFCGVRGSELRGLRWPDIGFNSHQIHVRQRADAFHKIGRLKSKAAYRSIPCNPLVLNTLREWKLVCPKGDQDLVFPTGSGKVESHSNIAQRGFEPVQIAAGVMEIRDGVAVAKYSLHALRHACASLWIEQGHNPKQIQTLMGHSTIQMTFDTYGHLFADVDADQKAAEEILVRLLGK